MKTLQSSLTWFFRQKLSGKLFIGCSGLFTLFCLCGFLSAILSPSNPTSEAVASTPDVSSIQTAIVETIFAGITQTAFAITPTHTYTPSATPTFSAEPSSSATFVPTSTPEQFATLASLGISCVPSTTKQEEGIVTNIVDGDTIDVNINGQTYRVRYIGIDTPERNENFFDQATALNRDLVNGKRVLLVKDVSETDRYDRILRYVFVNSTFVNYELVKQGYAFASTYPPDVACSNFFASAQNQAQSTQVGLWASVPVPTTVSNNGNSNSGGSGGGNCDPSYPTVCIPPPPPDLDCKDIPYNRFQVLPPDPHRFDGDDDGIGCES